MKTRNEWPPRYEDAKPRQPVEAAAQPAAPYSDTDAAKDMQTALKKIGAYPGAVDGVWGPQSRAAYFAFSERHGQ